MPRGVFKRHKYMIRCEVNGEWLTFNVGRVDHAPRFRWLCRDGRCDLVNLYRDGRLYHSWRRSEPVPMLREERAA